MGAKIQDFQSKNHRKGFDWNEVPTANRQNL